MTKYTTDQIWDAISTAFDRAEGLNSRGYLGLGTTSAVIGARLREGGPLDLKNKPNRHPYAGYPCPTKDCEGTVTFCGFCVADNLPGNIAYGFLQRQLDLSLKEMIALARLEGTRLDLGSADRFKRAIYPEPSYEDLTAFSIGAAVYDAAISGYGSDASTFGLWISRHAYKIALDIVYDGHTYLTSPADVIKDRICEQVAARISKQKLDFPHQNADKDHISEIPRCALCSKVFTG